MLKAKNPMLSNLFPILLSKINRSNVTCCYTLLYLLFGFKIFSELCSRDNLASKTYYYVKNLLFNDPIEKNIVDDLTLLFDTLKKSYDQEYETEFCANINSDGESLSQKMQILSEIAAKNKEIINISILEKLHGDNSRRSLIILVSQTIKEHSFNKYTAIMCIHYLNANIKNSKMYYDKSSDYYMSLAKALKDNNFGILNSVNVSCKRAIVNDEERYDCNCEINTSAVLQSGKKTFDNANIVITVSPNNTKYNFYSDKPNKMIYDVKNNEIDIDTYQQYVNDKVISNLIKHHNLGSTKFYSLQNIPDGTIGYATLMLLCLHNLIDTLTLKIKLLIDNEKTNNAHTNESDNLLENINIMLNNLTSILFH